MNRCIAMKSLAKRCVLVAQTRPAAAASLQRLPPLLATVQSFSSSAQPKEESAVRLDQYKTNTQDCSTVLDKKAAPNAITDNNNDDDDDEMEQEDMFVEPHESFEFRTREHGGPRRGGRFPEPTRYGDWERKGRCTDF